MDILSRSSNPILLLSHCKVSNGKLSAKVLDFRKLDFDAIKSSGPVPEEAFLGQGNHVELDEFTDIEGPWHGKLFGVKSEAAFGTDEWVNAVVLGDHVRA